MKTNNVMVRPMGQFNVSQRTKDGFFNATELLKQWNEYADNQQISNTQKNGYLKKKDMDDFFLNNNTKEFISALMEEEKLDAQKMVYMASRGNNGGTWMHPILFIKFAMWLNPRFEVQVIKFVYDQMIQYRNEAGDAYNELASAVAKIVDRSFMPNAMIHIAKGINYIIFGNHEHEVRNKYGEEKLQKKLAEFERMLSKIINDGFIKTYEQLISYLRREYQNKYIPSALI